MKSLLLVSLASVAFTFTLPASQAAERAPTAASAPSASPSVHGGRHLHRARAAGLKRRALRQLHLSAEQRGHVKGIVQATHASIKAIRADSTLAPDQKRTRIREAAVAARQQVRGVLTAEQRTRLDRAHHRRHRHKRS